MRRWLFKFAAAVLVLWTIPQDALFAAPSTLPTTAPAPTSEPNAIGATATFPLIANRANLYIRAKVNGTVEGGFVVDTGSSITSIEPELAQKLGIHPIARKTINTFEGDKLQDIAILDKLECGSAAFSQLCVIVCKCHSETLQTGERTLGVLGMDVLTRQPFAINFRDHTLTLYKPDEFVPPAVEAQSLRQKTETPEVRGSVEGHDGWFAIDTGYADTLLLTRSFVELNFDLVAGRPQIRFGTEWGEPQAFYGVRWKASDLFGVRAAEEFGNYDANDRFGRRTAGLIGLPKFRDRRLTIDMATRRAWREELPPEPLDVLVDRLRDKTRADPAEPSPIYEAALLRRDDAVRRLLELGESPDDSNEKRTTALMLAAAQNRVETIALLLEHGANVDATCAPDEFSSLLYAARFGRQEPVKRLVAAGANVNHASKSGRTALFLAAEGGYADVASFLIEKGAKIDARLKTAETPLLAACYNGDATCARLLLARGADAKAAGPHGTCLSYAASAASVECVTLLLQHGADPNAFTSRGPSPLMAAASVAVPEAAECVRLLLNAGADPGVKTDSGKNAFDVAVERGHVATVKLLHSAGKPSTAPSSSR